LKNKKSGFPIFFGLPGCIFASDSFGMKKYGLVGFPLSHSFSAEYFSAKFEKEGIRDCSYQLFPFREISELETFLNENPDILGLNITIPYKVAALKLVQEVDSVAAKIGAINVMKKMNGGGWKGYNTDYYGFLTALEILEPPEFWKGKNALILGTGGSSMAVAEALSALGMKAKKVSRTPGKDELDYEKLTGRMLKQVCLLVNCTPLGMYPNIRAAPRLPWEELPKGAYAVDLIYNPEKTLFLERSEKQGLRVQNGLPMLIAQAEKSWEIWNS
jgi:shikimate dehydrogenase